MAINTDHPAGMIVRELDKIANPPKEGNLPPHDTKTESTSVKTAKPHTLTSLLQPKEETNMSENTSPSRKRHTIAVYACGGLASNQIPKFHTAFADSPEGFANIELYAVDTSTSNFGGLPEGVKTYLIPNKDGSGQKRNLNASASLERVKEIVRSFKPADLNIIISSASGGSGSVLSPLITRELINSKLPTIVITVGDLTTRKFAENTIATLRSFENFTRAPDARPIVMAYFENKGAASRKEVDNQILRLVAELSCLFSGQNAELDSQDLYHWLNYHDVTDARVQLANLTVLHGNETLDESVYGGPIAVATIAEDIEKTDFAIPVDYQTIGLTAPGVYESSTVTHFVITDGYFDKVIARMDGQIKEIDEIKEARVQRESLITSDSNVDNETGLVF